MESSKMMGNCPQPLNLNQLFLKLNGFTSAMDNSPEVFIFNRLFLKVNRFFCDKKFSWIPKPQSVTS